MVTRATEFKKEAPHFGKKQKNNNLIDTIDVRLFSYAGNAPVDISEDISRLTQYLTAATKNDTELAKVLAYWIMQNIDYDVKAFLDGTYNNSGFQSTLHSRKGVCQDYSDLYKAMCDKVGITCYVVTGYAKGLGYKTGNDFNTSNHAWNIIVIDNNYYLMDLTWGSGNVTYSNNVLKYFRKADVNQLFAAPEKFIERHLPCNPQWQLLNYPVSMQSILKSDDFGDMTKGLPELYNYKDSIAAANKLNPLEQEIKLAEDSYRFFPLLNDLAFHYYNVAMKHSLNGYKLATQATYNENDLLIAIADYKKSIQILTTLGKLPANKYTGLIAGGIASSNQNIEYSTFRLNNKK
ncbi:MAG: hypothetical protein M3O71_04280 [Bacteroidota bacterium]|nr:hypothetical protein [Bacteroidota bacterium]